MNLADLLRALTAGVEASGSSFNTDYRERTSSENIARAMISASSPLGTAANISLEIAELNGHLTRRNYDFYREQNLARGMDPHEAIFDAFKKATDPEY